MTTFTIFYAWQDSLPQKATKNAIRDALRKASSSINTKHVDLRIAVDDATRGQAGSPNIPATIMRKIAAADAFFCDITTILKDTKQPNSNVVFELGYAVAQLGWERIVMLFNTEFGRFPDDVPFDFDRQRISKFSFPDPKSNSSPKTLDNCENLLNDLLTKAIQAIIEKKPPKPSEAGLTDEAIKKQRDVKNITRLMSQIHRPSFQTHLELLPRIVTGDSGFFYDGFEAVVNDISFYLYDAEAMRLVKDFYTVWKNIQSCPHLTINANNDYYFDTDAENLSGAANDDNDNWDAHVKDSISLSENFQKLQEYIRTHYLDIDLDQLSENARQQYVDFKKKSRVNTQE